MNVINMWEIGLIIGLVGWVFLFITFKFDFFEAHYFVKKKYQFNHGLCYHCLKKRLKEKMK